MLKPAVLLSLLLLSTTAAAQMDTTQRGYVFTRTPLVGQENAWRDGEGDSWERGPYWLDGRVLLS